jgi:RimJ/RimL family protein N-acetyltransferase
LEREHFPELSEAATDPRIWEFLSMDGAAPERFLPMYEAALQAREQGTEYPFVVYHKPSGKLIGSTRYLHLDERNRKLEIGWTWIKPEYWRTGINFECKLLLITYAFETLDIVRLQLLTSDQNFRSQKAIQKIGGVFEGVLRNERIRHTGLPRNSAFYSILDTEWESARAKILDQLMQREEAISHQST